MFKKYKHVDFSELLGKTITKIRNLDEYSDCVEIFCSDGSRYEMFHMQDCCERVAINEIIGDVNSLLNTPITKAEMVVSDADIDDEDYDYIDASATWTFYLLATVKGYLTIRWLGESNGWYSESVDFIRVMTET